MSSSTPFALPSAARTKGSLALKRPDELAGEVIRGLLARHNGIKPEMIEDVVLGCAMPEGEQGLEQFCI